MFKRKKKKIQDKNTVPAYLVQSGSTVYGIFYDMDKATPVRDKHKATITAVDIVMAYGMVRVLSSIPGISFQNVNMDLSDIDEVARQAALRKLTPTEIKLLGLIK